MFTRPAVATDTRVGGGGRRWGTLDSRTMNINDKLLSRRKKNLDDNPWIDPTFRLRAEGLMLPGLSLRSSRTT